MEWLAIPLTLVFAVENADMHTIRMCNASCRAGSLVTVEELSEHIRGNITRFLYVKEVKEVFV